MFENYKCHCLELKQVYAFVYLNKIFTKHWKMDGEILIYANADGNVTSSMWSAVRNECHYITEWFSVFFYMEVKIGYVRKKSSKKTKKQWELVT